MDDIFLLELAKKKSNHAWIGTRPPFNFEGIDLLNSTNYRVSASLHQNFEVVWFYEHCLNNLKTSGWKIVLDEAIRLLDENGLLVIRSAESENLTTPMIKNYIGRHVAIDAFVEYEVQDKTDNIWTFVFRIHRRHIEFYKDKRWTFAVLTNGEKVNNVIQFLQSIRKFDVDENYEIIISGPPNESYEKYNVLYLDISQFRDHKYAEISRKKNLICDMAKNPNIMIIHDRFSLDDGFFSGFEQFGYDFDFLTIKQYYESGTEFPSYCAMKNSLHWESPIKVDNYNQLYEGQYLNGGLLIFKTHILRRLKFNGLLMWNQMEDAEISRYAIDNSIVPRINFLSSATTIGIDESYTSTFQKENSKEIINPLNISFDSFNVKNKNKLSRYLGVSRFIPEVIKRKSKIYSNIKRYLLERI